MMEIANEVNLPSYVFLATNVGFLALVQYLPKPHSQNNSEFQPDSEDELLIPGIVSPVPPKVLPRGLFHPDGYDTFIKLGKWLAEAKGIIVNTFADPEPCAVNHFLSGQNYPSVYATGPILWQKAHPPPDGDLKRREEVMKWLNEQPEASVVFLCFGSVGSFNAPQVKEIALALELCGYRFLWSLRPRQQIDKGLDDLLPEGFVGRVNGRGMICGWAPQAEILSHKAVGGFVSHCGWNSILESLWFGVPIVTWPMYAEQQLNAFRMVKEMGLAVEMRLDSIMFGDELVMASEIETAIRGLMRGDNAVRKKVQEISLMAKKAVVEGGSSSVATERFIHDAIGNGS